jgi:hypothetical protein
MKHRPSKSERQQVGRGATTPRPACPGFAGGQAVCCDTTRLAKGGLAPRLRSPQKRRGGHFGPKPVADPRDAWLPPTRCTKAQRKQADVAAERAGVSLNAFVRLRMFGTAGPRAQRKPGEATKRLAQILGQMGKRGSNLNQIAHRLNMDELPALGELGAAIAEHRATCAAIMRALGLRPDANRY